jgi:hypothetical protein
MVLDAWRHACPDACLMLLDACAGVELSDDLLHLAHRLDAARNEGQGVASFLQAPQLLLGEGASGHAGDGVIQRLAGSVEEDLRGWRRRAVVSGTWHAMRLQIEESTGMYVCMLQYAGIYLCIEQSAGVYQSTGMYFMCNIKCISSVSPTVCHQLANRQLPTTLHSVYELTTALSFETFSQFCLPRR